MMISVSYWNNEFFWCSYFVYNNVKDDIPVVNDQVDINLVYRTFLTDKPWIIVRDIDWGGLNQKEMTHIIDQNPLIVKIK